MLDSLITSKTRIKLLTKFFLNPNTKGYLRSLADEFGESTNGVRVELNRLTEAGILESETEGRIKLYKANKQHSLFNDIHNIVKKFIGIDQIVEQIVGKLGDVQAAFITGDYARGIDSGIIDLVIVGNINRNYLNQLVEKAEMLIQRRIRTLTISIEELQQYEQRIGKKEKPLVVWDRIKKHEKEVCSLKIDI